VGVCTGSGQCHTMYFYEKEARRNSSRNTAPNEFSQLTIPPRKGSCESSSVVPCDPLLFDAAVVALGEPKSLIELIKSKVIEWQHMPLNLRSRTQTRQLVCTRTNNTNQLSQAELAKTKKKRQREPGANTSTKRLRTEAPQVPTREDFEDLIEFTGIYLFLHCGFLMVTFKVISSFLRFRRCLVAKPEDQLSLQRIYRGQGLLFTTSTAGSSISQVSQSIQSCREPLAFTRGINLGVEV
jgi:hypothetical protein